MQKQRGMGTSPRPKLEIRISKSDTNPKLEENNAQDTAWANCAVIHSRFHRFEFAPFEDSNLFRVSDFEFRISHARVNFEMRLGE
jgi:hypothetical protein